MGAADRSFDEQTAHELESLRTPPHSVEAEQSVLGGVMLDNSAWEQIADRLVEEDFYRTDHRLLFRAMTELSNQSQPFDAVTLAEVLQAKGKLEQAGGLAYIATLVRDTPTAANVRSYADIVRERAVLRQLIRVGGTLAESGYRPEGRSIAELVEDAERSVLAIGEKRTSGDPVLLADALKPWYEDMGRRENAPDGILGLRTGFMHLDEVTCGMEAGDLWIVAGRPGMGKTNFALSLGAERSIRNKDVGLFFSLEMSSNQLVSRLVSNVGRIHLDKIRRARMDDMDWKRTSKTTASMHESKLLIDDTPGLSTMDMRARARRVKQRHGLAYIIVDHIQLVRAKAENRTQEITNISRDLKALAKTMKVPVIALSQLNRGVEQRQNKRPFMSDLRESGSIEQDADVILFLYREGKYDHNFKSSIAEVNVAKQRNGPTDTVLLGYHGHLSCFENADPVEAEDYKRSNSSVSYGTSQRERGFDPNEAVPDNRAGPDR